MTTQGQSSQGQGQGQGQGQASVSGPRQALTLVLLVLALGAVGYFLYRLLADTSLGNKGDTVLQVLWLTLSLVLLLIVLLAVAVILRLVNPGRDTTALGLPEGSISAVIALTL